MESQKLFDTSKNFTVPIISGEEKRCVLRWPTDQEWAQRARSLRIVTQQLGRSKSQTETVNEDRVNAELFAKVRVDKDGPPFDEAEASAAIQRLDRTLITEATRHGANYEIALRAAGCDLLHVLRIPTKAEELRYRKAVVRVFDLRRQVEARLNLEASGELYDAVHVSHEGYAGPVPIVHKEAALREMLNDLQQLDEEGDPEF
jgi:hypothetical protein